MTINPKSKIFTHLNRKSAQDGLMHNSRLDISLPTLCLRQVRSKAVLSSGVEPYLASVTRSRSPTFFLTHI